MLTLDEYTIDLLGPLCLFGLLWLLLYLFIRRANSNRKIVNADNLKRLDFVWLTVAVFGLYLSGYDTIKSTAVIHGADARSEYNWQFDDLKFEITHAAVCQFHYVKSSWSPSNFDEVNRQNDLDCAWVHQVDAQLSELERPNFEQFLYPSMPSLKKGKFRDPQVADIAKKRIALEKLHEQAVIYARTAEFAGQGLGDKRGGPYLLAIALAIRFAKVHAELRMTAR
jgi:hypothetical protein